MATESISREELEKWLRGNKWLKPVDKASILGEWDSLYWTREANARYVRETDDLVAKAGRIINEHWKEMPYEVYTVILDAVEAIYSMNRKQEA